MEVQSWFTLLSVEEHRLNHRCLVVFIFLVCFSDFLFDIKVLLSICYWWQSLFHELLQLLDIEHRWNQIVVSAQFQE